MSIANAVSSLARVAVNPLLANTAEKARRLAICAECEFKKTGRYDICGQCGCPLDQKAGFAASTCPQSKW